MRTQSTTIRNSNKPCIAIYAIAGGWIAFVMLAVASIASAQIEEQVDAAKDPYGVNKKPNVKVGTGVVSKEGDFVDLNIPFRDHKNNLARVGDFFKDGKPVVLSFNYSNCPKLCSVQLENMVDALKQIDFKIGTDFEMVSVTIDPTETPDRAAQNIDIYLKRYNLSAAKDGFHFLIGEEKNIRKLANQTGFEYKYVESQKLYSHPPVFILLSPEGKIVRYIHGLDYDPKTMRLALIEAAEGKIGSPINMASYGLGCFVFDETTGKYTFQAMALMRLGGLLTIVGLAIGLVPYWFFRKGRSNPSPPQNENLTSNQVTA
jgi:protein SCO1/2